MLYHNAVFVPLGVVSNIEYVPGCQSLTCFEPTPIGHDCRVPCRELAELDAQGSHERLETHSWRSVVLQNTVLRNIFCSMQRYLSTILLSRIEHAWRSIRQRRIPNLELILQTNIKCSSNLSACVVPLHLSSSNVALAVSSRTIGKNPISTVTSYSRVGRLG